MPSENDIDPGSKSQNRTSADTRIQGAATVAILNEEENVADDSSNVR
jgi:hypothetical protein